MKWILEKILKQVGLGQLLLYVWELVLPKLREWAESDGKVDWDDKAVDIFDKLIRGLAGELAVEDELNK